MSAATMDGKKSKKFMFSSACQITILANKYSSSLQLLQLVSHQSASKESANSEKIIDDMRGTMNLLFSSNPLLPANPPPQTKNRAKEERGKI